MTTRASASAGRLARWGLAVLLPLTVGGGVASAAEFTLDLTLTAPLGLGDTAAKVTAALDPSATAGFDPGVDDVAYQVGPLQAWFLDAAAPALAQHLKIDTRPGTGEEVWTLQVVMPFTGTGDVVTPGDPVTVSWQPPATGGVCVARSMALVDGGGGVADMGVASGYTFAAPDAGVAYTLELVVGAPGSAAGAAPATPLGLVSPQQGRRGVLLMWEPVGGDGVAYHVERIHNPTDGALRTVTRVTTTPLRDTRWLDTAMVGQEAVAYRVVAVSGAGCESAPSEELLVAP